MPWPGAVVGEIMKPSQNLTPYSCQSRCCATCWTEVQPTATGVGIRGDVQRRPSHQRIPGSDTSGAPYSPSGRGLIRLAPTPCPAFPHLPLTRLARAGV